MKWNPAAIKLYCEIAAFGFAAIFLFGKLVTGQFNYGMDISLDVQRELDQKEEGVDNAAISIKLKRPDGGRVELTDAHIEVSMVTGNVSNTELLHSESLGNLIIERKETSGKIQDGFRGNGIFLPPSDGTQLGYYVKIPHAVPVLIDVTLVGKRTGPAGWFGNPQWRASAISLPQANT